MIQEAPSKPLVTEVSSMAVQKRGVGALASVSVESGDWTKLILCLADLAVRSLDHYFDRGSPLSRMFSKSRPMTHSWILNRQAKITPRMTINMMISDMAYSSDCPDSIKFFHACRPFMVP